MSSRSRSRLQVGTVINALADDSPSRESRTAAGRLESERGVKQQQQQQQQQQTHPALNTPLEHRSRTPAATAGSQGAAPAGLQLLPNVRGLKPASKPPLAPLSPLRTPASATEAARRVTPGTLADSEAQAIEEFRDKFIKSGAIKFSSLRDAFRKIDTNKNGAWRRLPVTSRARGG
jgi:hypothetical protein